MHINVPWNSRHYVGVANLCCAHACQPYHFDGVNWPTTVCETTMGYISVSSVLSAIIGITSYYCVILKMVIQHDAIKTIQYGVFVFFLKKEKSLFLFKTNKERVFLNLADGPKWTNSAPADHLPNGVQKRVMKFLFRFWGHSFGEKNAACEVAV